MQTEYNVGPDFEMYNKSVNIDEVVGLQGTTSLFNQYSVFALAKVLAIGKDLKYDAFMHYDDPEMTENARLGNDVLAGFGLMPPIEGEFGSERTNFSSHASKTPTAKNIIDYAQSTSGIPLMGPMPYSWSDFLYCKYYGLIPNNNLITLRRYALPVYDNAKVPNGDPLPPIAQAVTWLGNETGNKLSEIMSFSFGLVWKEIEATVQEVDGIERGFGAGAESLGAGEGLISGAGAVLTAIRGKGAADRWSGLAEKEVEWQKKAWTDEGPYWNQVYGPVNVVHKAYMRDRGLKFDHTINLNFHYSLKSINNLNPKVVMLDVITNFLTLTYSNAKFWGGAMRYFPNYKDSTAFFGDQNAFYSGDYNKYFDSITKELSDVALAIGTKLDEAFTSWDSFLKTVEDAVGGIVGMALGKLSKQSRPHILSIRSLLTGDPIGEWHLVIGNPMNPMFTIGNLIVDDVKIQFSDTLGADDFPTDVTFTVQLKHGKPRDKGDIESMFNYGHGKMTYSPISRVPSENGTYGDAWDKRKQADFKEQKKKTTADPTSDSDLGMSNGVSDYVSAQTADTLKRVSTRIRSQWGPTLADSSNLKWMLNKTKAKF